MLNLLGIDAALQENCWSVSSVELVGETRVEKYEVEVGDRIIQRYGGIVCNSRAFLLRNHTWKGNYFLLKTTCLDICFL